MLDPLHKCLKKAKHAKEVDYKEQAELKRQKSAESTSGGAK